MWRYGVDIALVAWALNALALAFGLMLGVKGMIDPHWAAKLVRLKADEQGGGFAEFRATYGGLFAFAHVVALYFSLQWIIEGEFMMGVYAAGAAAVLCAAWIGTAIGRAYSMLSDNTRTRFNVMSTIVEGAIGLCIGLPWVVWNFRPPG